MNQLFASVLNHLQEWGGVILKVVCKTVPPRVPFQRETPRGAAERKLLSIPVSVFLQPLCKELAEGKQLKLLNLESY